MCDVDFLDVFQYQKCLNVLFVVFYFKYGCVYINKSLLNRSKNGIGRLLQSKLITYILYNIDILMRLCVNIKSKYFIKKT